jgi:hypothetical protein
MCWLKDEQKRQIDNQQYMKERSRGKMWRNEKKRTAGASHEEIYSKKHASQMINWRGLVSNEKLIVISKRNEYGKEYKDGRNDLYDQCADKKKTGRTLIKPGETCQVNSELCGLVHIRWWVKLNENYKTT